MTTYKIAHKKIYQSLSCRLVRHPSCLSGILRYPFFPPSLFPQGNTGDFVFTKKTGVQRKIPDKPAYRTGRREWHNMRNNLWCCV